MTQPINQPTKRGTETEDGRKPGTDGNRGRTETGDGRKPGTDGTFANFHSSNNWGTSRLSPYFPLPPIVPRDQVRRQNDAANQSTNEACGRPRG